MNNYCDKCKVRVDGHHQNCPLCGAYIAKDDVKKSGEINKVVDYSYPIINPEYVVKNLMRKIALYFCLISSAVLVLVDLLFTGKIDWSFHVIVAWLIFWFTLGRTLFFSLELRRQIVWDSIFACFLCFYLQYVMGVGKKWAFEYGTPIVLLSCIGILSATMTMKLKQWERFCLPATVICVFATIPIIAYGIIYKTVFHMHIVSAAVGIIVILGMAILGNKKYFMEYKKKFHI